MTPAASWKYYNGWREVYEPLTFNEVDSISRIMTFLLKSSQIFAVV